MSDEAYGGKCCLCRSPTEIGSLCSDGFMAAASKGLFRYNISKLLCNAVSFLLTMRETGGGSEIEKHCGFCVTYIISFECWDCASSSMVFFCPLNCLPFSQLLIYFYF